MKRRLRDAEIRNHEGHEVHEGSELPDGRWGDCYSVKVYFPGTQE